jgi:transcription elongation factor GreA
MSTNKVRLTAKGYQKLKEELENLQTVERDKISAFMADVMSEGDISENSGYDDARAKMGALESRIFELEGLLSRAEIADEDEDTDVVGISATVKLDTVLGGRDEFTIVSTHEVDPKAGRISDESPIGMALMGKKVGSSVTVNGRKLKILAVRFE